MRPLVGPWALVLIFGGAVAPVVAAERELGAHLHGHGTVNLVIEGSTVWIELEAPGSDIVGFERAAQSAEEIATVAGARALLESPLLRSQPAKPTFQSESGSSSSSTNVMSAGSYSARKNEPVWNSSSVPSPGSPL